MLNFLSIIPYKIHPPVNGGHKGIAVFTDYLAEQTHLMAIGVTANDHTYPKPYPMAYSLSDSKFRYINFLYFFTIRSLIKKKHIQFFITEHPYYAWLGFLLQHFTNAKWIVHSHNIEFERFRDFGKPWWKILRSYESWAYRKADFVLCKTPEDKNKIANIIGGSADKLVDLPYGIGLNSLPTDRNACAAIIRKQYNIADDSYILLFNGALDYGPNRNALDKILNAINPLLLSSGLKYAILICGSKLPSIYDELKTYSNQNIIYCGFVDDISLYFKAANIFLNPVIGGGGIKTKLVEALAWNCNVVSTHNGAIGIEQQVCGNKLKIVDDDDNNAFAMQIIASTKIIADTPSTFYAYYNWTEIIRKFIQKIKN